MTWDRYKNMRCIELPDEEQRKKQRNFNYNGKNYSATAFLAYCINPDDKFSGKKGKSNAAPGMVKTMKDQIWNDPKLSKKWENSFDQLFVVGNPAVLLEGDAHRIDRQYVEEELSNIAWQDGGKKSRPKDSKVYAQCLIFRKPINDEQSLKTIDAELKNKLIDDHDYGFGTSTKDILELVAEGLQKSAVEENRVYVLCWKIEKAED